MVLHVDWSEEACCAFWTPRARVTRRSSLTHLDSRHSSRTNPPTYFTYSLSSSVVIMLIDVDSLSSRRGLSESSAACKRWGSSTARTPASSVDWYAPCFVLQQLSWTFADAVPRTGSNRTTTATRCSSSWSDLRAATTRALEASLCSLAAATTTWRRHWAARRPRASAGRQVLTV